MPPKPLFAGDRADRFMDLGDPGVDHDVQVDAAADDDPEQEQAERAEVAQRIVPAAEKQGRMLPRTVGTAAG